MRGGILCPMSKRGWLLYLAFKGCLIASLCLAPIAAIQAQTTARQESAAGAAAEPEDSWGGISPALLLHFLRRITDALETEAAKEDSAEKTEREIGDLKAQNEMADWAFWMMVASFAQAFIGALGVGAVTWSLYYTRVSIALSRQAIDNATDTAKRQLRAYVGVTDVRSPDFQSGKVYVVIQVRNTGQTPAHKMQLTYECMIGERDEFSLTGMEDLPTYTDLGRDVPYFYPVYSQTITNEQWREVKEFRTPLYVWGDISYFDEFKTEHHTRFRLKYSAVARGFTPCEQGNEST